MKLIKFINFNQPILSLMAVGQRPLQLIACWILLTFNITVSASADIQSLDEIKQTAKKFLEEMQPSADSNNIEIEIGSIDPRIRLTQCDGMIEAFLPQEARTTGKTTVGVRCLGTVAWKLYISANIKEFQAVWVAQKDISTNELITAGDIKLERVATSYLREIPLDDLNMILNASPVRSIRAGNIIFEDSVCLVCKGEKVAVTAQNEFMSIQVNGIALNNARLGESTQIKNSKSKRIFAATVVGKSQLSVPLSGSY